MTGRTAARRPVVVPLLRAAHIGPAVAVTCVVALLALSRDVPATQAVLLCGAVITGQLTVGWGNDLLDEDRDRRVGRTDKPLANGDLARRLVVRCLWGAAAATVVLSLLVGWRSGLVHLVLGVAAAHLYNLHLKTTAWSWLPYAVAFGSLPAGVTLAGDPARLPPLWMPLVAAALGVAAHFLNALPDLAADAATGVRGLPHRLGATASSVIATALLVAGSAVAVLGPAGAPGGWAWPVLLVVVGLAAAALVGRGKLPFYAAIAIALLDVSLLTVVAR